MKNKKVFNKIFKTFYQKKILITGNTGFKGVWLSKILEQFTNKIYGISYDLVFSNDKLYKKIKNNIKIKTYQCDITKKKKLEILLKKIKPDFVFHFAAQSLVLRSYEDPNLNFATNVIGSINLIQSLNNIKSIKKIFLLTTDKVYHNDNKVKKFNENDPLGGDDPYSLSKVLADHIFQYHFKYIFLNKKIDSYIIRSGNVYGGGDFAKDRLISDFYCNKTINIRYPNSTRPFQHILDVIYCYLYITTLKNKKNFVCNVGPYKSYKVLNVIKYLKRINPNKKNINLTKGMKIIEKEKLSLSLKKINLHLNWIHKINIKKGLKLTQAINAKFNENGKIVNNLINSQISEYNKLLK